MVKEVAVATAVASATAAATAAAATAAGAASATIVTAAQRWLVCNAGGFAMLVGLRCW